MPAPQLVRTLGVSLRTIFREMDALSSAGIPVYAKRGAEGGCCLVEDYHTDLTGQNEDEARALFVLTAPGPLDSMEVGQKMRSALRKLATSLPGYLESPVNARPRIHLDWTGWQNRPAAGELLGLLYRVVQRQEQVRLTYRLWIGIEIEELACPLGLVAKTGEWHLAWRGPPKLHWQRVSRSAGACAVSPDDNRLRAPDPGVIRLLNLAIWRMRSILQIAKFFYFMLAATTACAASRERRLARKLSTEKSARASQMTLKPITRSWVNGSPNRNTPVMNCSEGEMYCSSPIVVSGTLRAPVANSSSGIAVTTPSRTRKKVTAGPVCPKEPVPLSSA